MINTTNFEKWAKGKNPLLAVVAHSMVIQSRAAYGVINAIKNEDMFFGKDIAPDLDTWLYLFRSHSSGENYFSQLLGSQTDLTGRIKRISSTVNQFAQDVPLADLNTAGTDAQQIYRDYLKTIQTIEEDLDQDLSAEAIEQIVLNPEFYFFFRVSVPCWLLLFTTPAQLLRKARLRDFESLLKIIRLDPSAVFDRKISRYVHELRSANRAKYEQIQDALKNDSNSKITRTKFKLFFASIIMNVSIELGHKLTEPEVRGIFDAVARDEGRGEIDTDLPENAHTLYMAMKRKIETSS